ncbi:hypothetical protein [Exiguobacterium antarcticum]|uniref:hypothetical protein n=1 Tax=Exiguobacterium antarcticum TaxID=132920 RepID=UPI000285EB44|nr:hypothetical protein [Exiguobacterium antarcticum]AFS70296.1 Hypothetical protein Eab7_1160 [Exiguobacterium antarcticum B7]
MEKKQQEVFSMLGQPAKRALAEHGVTSLVLLAAHSEQEVRRWHGIGPSSIPKLKQALAEQGLTFKK